MWKLNFTTTQFGVLNSFFFLNLNFVQKFEIVFKLVLLSQHVQSLCLESAAECDKIAHRLPVIVSTAASDVWWVSLLVLRMLNGKPETGKLNWFPSSNRFSERITSYRIHYTLCRHDAGNAEDRVWLLSRHSGDTWMRPDLSVEGACWQKMWMHTHTLDMWALWLMLTLTYRSALAGCTLTDEMLWMAVNCSNGSHNSWLPQWFGSLGSRYVGLCWPVDCWQGMHLLSNFIILFTLWQPVHVTCAISGVAAMKKT